MLQSVAPYRNEESSPYRNVRPNRRNYHYLPAPLKNASYVEIPKEPFAFQGGPLNLSFYQPPKTFLHPVIHMPLDNLRDYS